MRSGRIEGMQFGLKALFVVMTLACVVAAFPPVIGIVLQIALLAAIIFGPLVAGAAAIILIADYVARGLAANTDSDESDQPTEIS